MKQQRGAALLLLYVVVFVLTATVLLARQPADAALHRRGEIRHQLAHAKEALLAYAVTYEDNYFPSTEAGAGYLPCPNLDLPEKDEAPNPPCNSHSPIIGRLPGDFAMRAGSVHESLPAGTFRGEELWYALSKGFQNNHKPPQLNTTSRGRLTVDGENDVVAVIIAPGPTLPGQRRPSADPRDYLEGENSDGDNDFASTTEIGNDQLIVITRADFDTRVAGRVAADLKRRLDRAFDLTGGYPTELPADLPEWFLLNWSAVTRYTATGETATVQFAGCAITFVMTRTAPAPARDRPTCA